MKAHTRLVNPDDIEVQITFTMRAKDWRELADQLSSAYPSWAFGSLLCRAVSRLHENYLEDGEDPAP